MRLNEEIRKIPLIQRTQTLKVVARMKQLFVPFRSPEHIGELILGYAQTMPKGEIKDEVTFIGETLKDNPELCYPEFYAYFKKRNADKPLVWRAEVNRAVANAVRSHKRTFQEIAKWKAEEFPEEYKDEDTLSE